MRFSYHFSIRLRGTSIKEMGSNSDRDFFVALVTFTKTTNKPSPLSSCLFGKRKSSDLFNEKRFLSGVLDFDLRQKP